MSSLCDCGADVAHAWAQGILYGAVLGVLLVAAAVALVELVTARSDPGRISTGKLAELREREP